MLRFLAILSFASLVLSVFINLDLQAQEYTDIKVSKHNKRDCYFIQVHPHEQNNDNTEKFPVVRAYYTYSYKNSNNW